MRVFIISLGTLAVLGFFLIMTRFWGLNQQYPPLDHVLLKNENQPIAVIQAETIDEIQNISEKVPQSWIWLNVRTSADGKIYISNTKENFRRINSQEWKSSHPNAMTLGEAYQHFPKLIFVLNIMETAPETHLLVIQETQNHSSDERTVIQSDTLSIVKALKDLKPQWLFGTSRSDLLQLLTMTSVGAGPIAQMSGDLFIAPLQTMNRPSFDESVLSEVKRRNKWRIIGPLVNDLQVAEAKKWGAEGYVFANIELFLNYSH